MRDTHRQCQAARTRTVFLNVNMFSLRLWPRSDVTCVLCGCRAVCGVWIAKSAKNVVKFCRRISIVEVRLKPAFGVVRHRRRVFCLRDAVVCSRWHPEFCQPKCDSLLFSRVFRMWTLLSRLLPVTAVHSYSGVAGGENNRFCRVSTFYRSESRHFSDTDCIYITCGSRHKQWLFLYWPVA